MVPSSANTLNETYYGGNSGPTPCLRDSDTLPTRPVELTDGDAIAESNRAQASPVACLHGAVVRGPHPKAEARRGHTASAVGHLGQGLQGGRHHGGHIARRRAALGLRPGDPARVVHQCVGLWVARWRKRAGQGGNIHLGQFTKEKRLCKQCNVPPATWSPRPRYNHG